LEREQLFGFGIAQKKARDMRGRFGLALALADYVRPAKRVARLGAAICGERFRAMLCNWRSMRHDFILGLGAFDCAARRSARFGLVFCIVYSLRCGGGIASDRARHARPTSSNT